MVHWQDFVDAMSLLLSLSLVVLEPVWSTVLLVVLSPTPIAANVDTAGSRPRLHASAEPRGRSVSFARSPLHGRVT